MASNVADYVCVKLNFGNLFAKLDCRFVNKIKRFSNDYIKPVILKSVISVNRLGKCFCNTVITTDSLRSILVGIFYY